MGYADDFDDGAERDRLGRLFACGDAVIDAGFDALPAAVWLDAASNTLKKVPLLPHGHLDAHRDKQLLRQQLINPPHVPSSVPPSFIVVVGFVPGSGGCGCLDCDIKNGKIGDKTLRELTNEHGNFVGAAWQSPSGGVNILFDKPAGMSLGNTSPWTGIDVRADNGWVVAPGNMTAYGDWAWKAGGFSTRLPLPAAMIAELRPAAMPGRYASSAETVAFIEASRAHSSYDAQRAFGEQLDEFRNAAIGSRHDAMARIVSWSVGMVALDLQWAMEQIKREWDVLTRGEARQDEVDEFLRWVVGREVDQRAAGNGQGSAHPASVAVIDGYQQPLSATALPPPIDWTVFKQRAAAPQDWLVEHFWPWGRSMAVWADAKAGKSELALWIACNLALGVHPWTGAAQSPLDVAYFDFEMTPDDLDDRLNDFDIDPALLVHLHYWQLPPIDPLNTERGGSVIAALVERYDVSAVVIDTLIASVVGDENSSETIAAFSRFTGNRLKAAGVGYLRTDHAGRDHTAGARGSSAKRGDVDVVWGQKRRSGGVVLDCTGSSRVSWVGPKVDLDRIDTNGVISYRMPLRIGWTQEALAKARQLDAAGVPLDAGRPRAREMLKAAGVQPGRNAVLGEALEYRRTTQRGAGPRPGTGGSENTPGTGSGDSEGQDGTIA